MHCGGAKFPESSGKLWGARSLAGVCVIRQASLHGESGNHKANPPAFECTSAPLVLNSKETLRCSIFPRYFSFRHQLVAKWRHLQLDDEPQRGVSSTSPVLPNRRTSIRLDTLETLSALGGLWQPPGRGCPLE